MKKAKDYHWPKSTNITVLETPCREYQGNRHLRDGYGRRTPTESSSETAVHRWVWEQINGPIPDGMLVLHRCDNAPCFRYSHLFLGTDKDNARDRQAKGRSKNLFQPGVGGNLRPQAKLTWAIVDEIRRLGAEGVHPRVLAERFDTHVSNIRSILKCRTWKPENRPQP